ncbi:MAG: D-tyrosyl-tRNA(Tyr) deacylase [Bacteroidetes bacterium MedPE-SWsnd-G2]|nr:MAG: D-tyrosyl-tRNA(Tyr) deacylase [Bacteroidetes bacterium MedPE-SWsnd-G2]
MRVVVQRVSESKVVIEGEVVASIGQGVLVLLGITNEDTQEDIDWLCRKIVNLRIFNDASGIMNNSLLEIDGEVIVVSQFTLHASTKKGNRPSYINAAKPLVAKPLYNLFKSSLQTYVSKPVQSGEFGADMKVSLVNDGPVTIIIDSKNKQ